MKKVLGITLFALVTITGLFVIRFIIGGNEDTWICTNGEWTKHGNPANPAPQNGCGQNVTLSTENTVSQSVENAITQILNQKYNRPNDRLIVTTTNNTGSFAKGAVNFSEGGGGIWFAAKIDDVWQLVYDGNGIIQCSALKQYSNFPSILIPQCFDDKANILIKR